MAIAAAVARTARNAAFLTFFPFPGGIPDSNRNSRRLLGVPFAVAFV